MFWLILYNLLLILAFPFITLYFACSRTDVHYVKAKTTLSIERTVSGNIWIHALSVGEALSIIPMIKLINKDKNTTLYMSVSTTTAYKLMKGYKKKLGLKTVFILPFDFPWLMRGLVYKIKPALFILTEGDVWPNLLHFLKTSGTKNFLVNGRMSPQSSNNYSLLKALGWNLFAGFTTIFPSSLDMKKVYNRFVPEEKLLYCGNIKWDAAREKVLSPKESQKLLASLGLNPEAPIWTAGSIHRGEEDIILATHKNILKTIPETVLILAPRNAHEDCEYFADKCNAYKLPLVKRSSGHKAFKGGVYLIDSIGELMQFYSISRVAFVGGSMVPKGGHNILEPAIYGVPVGWGPYIFNFKETADYLKSRLIGQELYSQEHLEAFIKQHLTKTSSDKRNVFTETDSPSATIWAFIKRLGSL